MNPTGQNENIGQIIRRYRQVRGMSQSDLAAKLGVDGSYLSRMEVGERKPSENMLRLLASAFGVCVEQLMLAGGMVTEAELRNMGIVLPSMMPLTAHEGTFDDTRMVALEALVDNLKVRIEALEIAHNELVQAFNAMKDNYNLV